MKVLCLYAIALLIVVMLSDIFPLFTIIAGTALTAPAIIIMIFVLVEEVMK